jgi:hypothetical protein
MKQIYMKYIYEIYIYIYEDIMNPTAVWKVWRWGRELREHNRGGELVQSTAFTPMELSQWSPLVILMYANKNCKKVEKRELTIFLYGTTMSMLLTS